MSNSYPGGAPYGADSATDTGAAGAAKEAAGVAKDQAKETAGVAKDQAAQLGHETAAASQRVTGVAKDEAGKVAAEAKTQAKDLYHQTKGELTSQVGSQKDRVSSGLLALSEELKSLGKGEAPEKSGIASDLVGQASSRVESIATWVSDREPRELLDEVTAFARRKPGTFIALAALTGVLAGRLTRSVVAEVKDEKEAASTPALTTGYDTSFESDYVAPSTSTFVEPAYYSGSGTSLVADGDIAGGYGTTTGALDEPVLDPTTSTDRPYLGDTRI